MVKVNYYTKIIEFSQKTQKVMYIFKRLPTREQLEAFAKQQQEPQPRRQMAMSGLSIGNIFQMFEEPELELNWDKVRIVVTKEQSHEANLKIGDVIQLDIPEEHSDIQIVSEGPKWNWKNNSSLQ